MTDAMRVRTLLALRAASFLPQPFTSTQFYGSCEEIGLKPPVNGDYQYRLVELGHLTNCDYGLYKLSASGKEALDDFTDRFWRAGLTQVGVPA